MADLTPRRECNPLAQSGGCRWGGGGGMPGVGASICTVPYPAFSLGSTNAMAESAHGGPHLLPFVAMFLGGSVGGMQLGSADI